MAEITKTEQKLADAENRRDFLAQKYISDISEVVNLIAKLQPKVAKIISNRHKRIARKARASEERRLARLERKEQKASAVVQKWLK